MTLAAQPSGLLAARLTRTVPAYGRGPGIRAVTVREPLSRASPPRIVRAVPLLGSRFTSESEMNPHVPELRVHERSTDRETQKPRSVHDHLVSEGELEPVAYILAACAEPWLSGFDRTLIKHW